MMSPVRCSANYRYLFMEFNLHHFIRSKTVLVGMTMKDLVEMLHLKYGRSDSVSNLSGKLSRGSLRYEEALEIADVLGYDIVWQRRDV